MSFHVEELVGRKQDAHRPTTGPAAGRGEESRRSPVISRHERRQRRALVIGRQPLKDNAEQLVQAAAVVRLAQRARWATFSAWA